MDNKQLKRERALNQIKRIKGFYTHLLIFLSVMLVIGVFYLLGYSVCLVCFDGGAMINFVGFLPWLVILCIQGLVAFGKIPFLRRWEAKKIEQFIGEDDKCLDE